MMSCKGHLVTLGMMSSTAVLQKNPNVVQPDDSCIDLHKRERSDIKA